MTVFTRLLPKNAQIIAFLKLVSEVAYDVFRATLHTVWGRPEHRLDSCPLALNPAPLYELFLGPALSHVKF